MDNNYQFLRAQVKAFHPEWSDAEIENECKKILASNNTEDEDGCLYCGS